MRKVVGTILAIVMLFAVASPALAAETCTVQKVEGTRFARLRVVCTVTEPTSVNQTTTAQSSDGNSQITSSVMINNTTSGSVSIRTSTSVSVTGTGSAFSFTSISVTN